MQLLLLSCQPIQIVNATEMLDVWIKILNPSNVNQIRQLINPMITTKAAITDIQVVDKVVAGMIIVTIITEDDMNFIIIKMVLINRTQQQQQQHHQISSHVDRTKDDNGCRWPWIQTVFGFYDFLLKIFLCGTYNHRLVLWLFVYFWCIINMLWFDSVKLWCRCCRIIIGRIYHFSSIVLFVVNLRSNLNWANFIQISVVPSQDHGKLTHSFFMLVNK